MTDHELDFNVAIQSDKKNASADQIKNEEPKENDDIPKEMLQDKIKDKSEEKITIRNAIQRAANPILCLITILVKAIAIASFILLSIFLQNSTIYLIVILLGAADFWIMKNLSGRKLVGLRWWNEVKENGEEVWIFESKNERKHLPMTTIELESTADKSVFWTCLYGNAGAWLAIFLYELITLTPTWGIIALTMLIFAGTNLFGFFKCSKDQQSKMVKLGGKVAINVAKKGAEKGLEVAK